MAEERKVFQYLSGEENPQFVENGKKIYLELRKKYPNDTAKDLDTILNSLCAALLCLIKCNVAEENHLCILQVVWKILKQNIKD